MQMCIKVKTEPEQVSAGSVFPLLTESKNELIWREKWSKFAETEKAINMLFLSVETWIDAIIMQDIYQRIVLWHQHDVVINKTSASFSPPALCCLLNPLASLSVFSFVFLSFRIFKSKDDQMCCHVFNTFVWLGCWQNNHWHTFRSLQKLLPLVFV